jgi:endo-1,4-beta-xylanase
MYMTCAALVSFVKDFNAKHKDVKFDGIGTQTHLQPGQGKLVAATLRTLATAGVEVAITELDVSNAPSKDYVEVVTACKAIKACVSITTWGPSDDPAERSDSALLFDAESKPKKAYFDVVAALSK